MHKRIGRWLRIKTNEGIARTQSPTNKNDAVELSTFEIIAGVNPTEVQWKGLALGEPPSWSWLTPQPGKYAHETDSLVDTIQFHSNVFGTLTQHIWIPPIMETVIPNKYSQMSTNIPSHPRQVNQQFLKQQFDSGQTCWQNCPKRFGQVSKHPAQSQLFPSYTSGLVLWKIEFPITDLTTQGTGNGWGCLVIQRCLNVSFNDQLSKTFHW